MNLPQQIDVAIIGAGAAGLGAAHALKDSSLSVLVLEARNRIGGRAHTLNLQSDICFDEGCGWLHAANVNSFVPIAEQCGFEISKERPPWGDSNVGNANRDGFEAAMDAFYERLHTGAKEEPDVAASFWLEPGNRWNTAIESAGTYINGCRLDQVSTHDLDAYTATGKNWRIVRGYGTLLQAYGAPCPVILNTKVTLIDHSGALVKLETSRGTLRAKAVIVTLPTNLIADEAVQFMPPLPGKREAAANLPLGVANKVVIGFEEAKGLPADGYLNVALDRVDKGAYHLRPFGKPCIEGYFGGGFARDLEKDGPNGIAMQAIDEIVAVLGEQARPRLKPLHESHWVEDIFARGSYSYAKPGHSGDRARLAEPVDDCLFFAGEATSPNFFSTAHGARDSGERAAQEVLKALS